MKHIKRILAMITAFMLILPLAGCLVPKNNDESAVAAAPSGVVPAPDGTNGSESPNESEFDGQATAIELGDIQITAAELSDTFDQYVGYFSYGGDINEETLDQFMRMTEETLIEYYMPEWKATELGLSLTEEQEATCAAEAQTEVDDEHNMLLCYYGDPDGTVEDAAQLTDEQIASANAEIAGILTEMFGEGYTLDDYLSMRYDSALSSRRIALLTELLNEQSVSDVSVDQAAIDEWYKDALEEQRTEMTEDPTLYLGYQNGSELSSYEISLYVPAKAALLELVCVPEDESEADRIAENADAMTNLEAEYGKLVLCSEDETRQAEIKAEYDRLKQENETLLAEQADSSGKKIGSAYAELEGGASFAAVMDAYNAHEEGESGAFELTVFLDGSEPDYPELAEAANKLSPGAYSQVIRVDGDYYIVRLKEVMEEGVVDRASIEENLKAVVTEHAQAEAQQAQTDAWLEEAKAAAVYHRETYDMLIATYLG